MLTRLWEEERRSGSHTLRAATLERLGGAERLVRSHLADALAELDDHSRDVTAAVFHQLGHTLGDEDRPHRAGSRGVRGGPRVGARCRYSRRSPAARILRPVDPAPGETTPRFEIFHDVLAPAILDWRAAHEQARVAREEAARRRTVRRRLAAGGSTMLLLVVVFAGLAIWALGQRSEAQKQAEVARSQALAASAVSQLDADPELGLLLAVEAAEGKPTREAEDALRRALTSSRLRAVVPRPAALSAAPRSHPTTAACSPSTVGGLRTCGAQPEAAATSLPSAPASSTTRLSIRPAG